MKTKITITINWKHCKEGQKAIGSYTCSVAQTKLDEYESTLLFGGLFIHSIDGGKYSKEYYEGIAAANYNKDLIDRKEINQYRKMIINPYDFENDIEKCKDWVKGYELIVDQVAV